MCVICHGPLRARGNQAASATTCGENCRQALKRQRRGMPLAGKYQDQRTMHAYRREMEATYVRIEGMAQADNGLFLLALRSHLLCDRTPALLLG